MVHQILGDQIGPGDICVDATAGNGHDAGFLAGAVGARGVLYALDIKKEAVDATRQRLETDESLADIHLIRRGHEQLVEVLDPKHIGQIRAIVFNLGFLPGGSRHIVTHAETTIPGLEQSLTALAPEGLLSIMMYPGRPEGKIESNAVKKWVRTLDPHLFTATNYCLLNRTESAPSIVFVQKMSSASLLPSCS